MSKYLIELPHTKEECLRALDETRGSNRELLPLIDWGCSAGNHNGWVTVDAVDEFGARSRVSSDFLRGKAIVTKVDKVTEAQIESYHKM